MNRNTTTESSLLLQLPKSVLSFSDMSGNSFLLPVAVDNVAAPENPIQNSGNPEKHEETPKVTEPKSVCQLQQPLLMRRGSSPGPKMTVPYSESNAQVTDVSSVQTEIFHSRSSLQPSVSNATISNQGSENLNWPNSSVNSSVGQTVQSNLTFSGFQNQPHTVPPESISQSNYFQSNSHNQESSNLGYQNIYPPQQTVSPSSNYPNSTVPVVNTVFPGFPGKSSVHPDVCAPPDYYSQPPVITPSSAPSYYNNSGRNISQAPQTYSSVPNQSYSMHNRNIVEEYSRVYEPVKPYWFYKEIVETIDVWRGFSTVDSDRLEMAFQQDPQSVVPVEGGRYDALLSERLIKPVYFEAADLQIRRCSWFYREHNHVRYEPFSEEVSSLLEQHYSTCVTSGQWQKRINVPGLGSIVLEHPQLILYYKYEVEVWSSLPVADPKASPIPVKRGLPDNVQILPSENDHIDHLVFIVQGIGSFCDLRFRTVTECVDGFRDIANKLLYTHFKREVDSGQIGRIEFLPLGWHAKLHTSDKGFDRCMQNITLPSIPKLRHFTNDTLLDILLYSSPFYCQCIIDTVASELNKLYEIFLKRNSGFSGNVFVAGHSLGSLILFDILANQKVEDSGTTPNTELDFMKDSVTEITNNDVPEVINKDAYDSIASLLQACQLEEYTELFEKEKIDLSSVAYLSNDDLKDLGLPVGPRKKLLNAVHSNSEAKSISQNNGDASGSFPSISSKEQNVPDENKDVSASESLVFPLKSSPCMQSIAYPRLRFQPACFFALGSPISMFLTVRGYHSISEDFRFPTCPGFFHIFHPYDPVAYRIESLIDPNFSAKPVLIPHHKGRKRMHLEIRENISKVGLEIKQKVLETLRSTWNSVTGFARAHAFPSSAIEAEVDKLVHEQMEERQYEQQAQSETSGEEIQIGSLNGGRRIDYVLQEKPIEALNDYIFALTSHSTYWNSEDTVLMILREIYATQGILVSSQSVLESRQSVHLEQSSSSSFETYQQLNPVMSNPCIFESSDMEQVPASVSPFYNQSIPPVIPASSQSLYSNVSMSQVASGVPTPSLPAVQPVGPPPLSGFVKKSPFTR